MSKPSPFSHNVEQGQESASWPRVLQEEDNEALPAWLDEVRRRLALVQFQGFLQAMAQHWPPAFKALGVSTVKGRVLFSTHPHAEADHVAIEEAEDAFMKGVKPFISGGGRHFENLISMGFGNQRVTPVTLEEVLERALSDQPEVWAELKASRLEAAWPSTEKGRSVPRM